MKKKDTILTLLFEMSHCGERPVEGTEIQRISVMMGSSKSRFRSYISDLAKDGMITLDYGTIRFRRLGVDRANDLSEELDDSWLDADEHSLPQSIRLGSLKNRFKDKWERLMITSVFLGGRTKNLSQVISIMDHVRLHEKKVNLENELLHIENESMAKPISLSLLDSTLLGIGNVMDIISKDTGDVLNVANLLRKQGKLELARNLYSKILDLEGLNKNQFIVCRVGQAQLERAMGREEQAITIVQSIISKDNTRSQNAYLDLVLAEMLMDRDIESALPLLRKGVAVFESMGADNLVSLAYIYLGLYYFRVEKEKAAMHYLELGRRHAKKGRSDYLQGYALHNLADAVSLMGNTKKAHEMLDRSMDMLSKLSNNGGDLEGRAGVHFNRALVHIQEGLFDEAKKEFDRSMQVAFPLPIKNRREEWKRVFKERIEKKKITSQKV